jgi:hypothetical protein
MTILWADIGPVVVAVSLRQAISLIWWSPLMFARQYAALSGVTMDEFRRRWPWVFGVDTVGAVFTALALRYVIDKLGATSLLGGVGIGLMIWFAFNVVTRASLTLYARRPMQLYGMTTAFFGITMALMGGVFGYLD